MDDGLELRTSFSYQNGAVPEEDTSLLHAEEVGWCSRCTSGVRSVCGSVRRAFCCLRGGGCQCSCSGLPCPQFLLREFNRQHIAFFLYAILASVFASLSYLRSRCCRQRGQLRCGSCTSKALFVVSRAASLVYYQIWPLFIFLPLAIIQAILYSQWSATDRATGNSLLPPKDTVGPKFTSWWQSSPLGLDGHYWSLLTQFGTDEPAQPGFYMLFFLLGGIFLLLCCVLGYCLSCKPKSSSAKMYWLGWRQGSDHAASLWNAVRANPAEFVDVLEYLAAHLPPCLQNAQVAQGDDPAAGTPLLNVQNNPARDDDLSDEELLLDVTDDSVPPRFRVARGADTPVSLLQWLVDDPDTPTWVRLQAKLALYQVGLLAWYRERNPVWHVVFTLWKLVKLYARLFLWKTVFIKIWIGYAFLHQTDVCRNKQMVYSYEPSVAGGYRCAYCPTWAEVDPWSQEHPQLCLDGVLSAERSPARLFAALDAMVPHEAQVTTIDLSRQCWSNWTSAEVSQLFAKLRPYSHIRTLNVSRSALPDCPLQVSAQVVSDLTEYLRTTHAPISRLDLSGCAWLPDQYNWFFANAFISGTGVCATLQHLNLSHTLLTDAASTQLSRALTRLQRPLLSLSVRNCKLTQVGLGAVLAAPATRTITDLDIGNNLAGDLTLELISAWVSGSSVHRLSMSDTTLGGANFTQWKALEGGLLQSNVTVLDFTSCGLLDFAAISSPLLQSPSPIRLLLLGDNNIGHMIFPSPLQVCAGNIESIDLSGQTLGLPLLSSLGSAFANCTRTMGRLGLRDIGVTLPTWQHFTNTYLPFLPFDEYDLSSNRDHNGDDILYAVQEAIGRHPTGLHPLRHLTLTNNGVTSTGLHSLFTAYPHQLFSLVVSECTMRQRDGATEAMAVGLKAGSLTTLRLDYCTADNGDLWRPLLQNVMTHTSLLSIAVDSSAGTGRGSITADMVLPLVSNRLPATVVTVGSLWSKGGKVVKTTQFLDTSKLSAARVTMDQQRIFYRHIWPAIPGGLQLVLRGHQLGPDGVKALCRVWSTNMLLNRGLDPINVGDSSAATTSSTTSLTLDVRDNLCDASQGVDPATCHMDDSVHSWGVHW